MFILKIEHKKIETKLDFKNCGVHLKGDWNYLYKEWENIKICYFLKSNANFQNLKKLESVNHQFDWFV